MARRTRRTHSRPSFKAKVVLVARFAATVRWPSLPNALRYTRTRYNPGRDSSYRLPRRLSPEAAAAPRRSATRRSRRFTRRSRSCLWRRIFSESARARPIAECRTMIVRTHRLPVVRQSRLVDLNRSTRYYRPRAESEENLAATEEIDRLYMERPTSRSRTIKSMLEARGRTIARSRVVRLMRLMGLRAIYPKRRTSSLGEGHISLPAQKDEGYETPEEVYAVDIMYIPMVKGFLYLTAVIDWHSRKALAHRLSNTLDVPSALKRFRRPLPATARRMSPRGAVYFTGVHRCAQGAWRAHLDGRQGALVRQRVRRVPLTQPQAGRSLPHEYETVGEKAHRRLPALL